MAFLPSPCGCVLQAFVAVDFKPLWLCDASFCGYVLQAFVAVSRKPLWQCLASPCGSVMQAFVAMSCKPLWLCLAWPLWLLLARPCGCCFSESLFRHVSSGRLELDYVHPCGCSKAQDRKSGMTHATEKLHVVNTGREHQRRVSGTKCAVFVTTCTKARKICTVENHVHACQGENKKRRLWAPMSSIGGSVKDVVDGILSSEHPVLVKVKKICDCLEESGLCWRQTLTPDQVLVHPSNRGGSLVAAQDVWRQGERILAVGLRKELMTDSIAFEVSLEETKKQKQCQANVDLCKANPFRRTSGFCQ